MDKCDLYQSSMHCSNQSSITKLILSFRPNQTQPLTLAMKVSSIISTLIIQKKAIPPSELFNASVNLDKKYI
eukprot:15251398-Ditylum_brightwellii.AAC.2